MEKLLLFCSLFILSFGGLVQAQNKAEIIPMDSTLTTAQLTFVSNVFDFGEVRKGEKITTSFYFKNTGTRPLFLLQVQTSCGCTATSWSREPIQPNATGEIQVTFDTSAKEDIVGEQQKVLLVISNSLSKEDKLIIKGTVKKV